MNTTEPKAFEILPTEMLVMTKLKVEEGFAMQEGTTIENYIGGVYVQVRYGESNETEADRSKVSYEYSLPINCTELINGNSYEEVLDPFFEDYLCPDRNMLL